MACYVLEQPVDKLPPLRLMLYTAQSRVGGCVTGNCDYSPPYHTDPLGSDGIGAGCGVKLCACMGRAQCVSLPSLQLSQQQDWQCRATLPCEPAAPITALTTQPPPIPPLPPPASSETPIHTPTPPTICTYTRKPSNSSSKAESEVALVTGVSSRCLPGLGGVGCRGRGGCRANE